VRRRVAPAARVRRRHAVIAGARQNPSPPERQPPREARL
jgi:hypothetical protein